MRADRLAVVLRLRDLAERRRLAERTVAAGAAADARRRHADARAARYGATAAADASLTPGRLIAIRLAGIALDEAVEAAATGEARADRALHGTEVALRDAAVARRSAERLRDRRLASAARGELRHELRRADDVALQQWRSRS